MSNNYKISYTYDLLNRLSSVSYGDGKNAVYTYDPAGNIIAVQSDVDLNATLDEPTCFDQPHQKFCTKCGGALKPNKSFCTQCGTPIKAKKVN